MKIEEIYPDATRYGHFSEYDYNPLLSSFGPIVLQVDDHDYQGDSRVLYKKGDRFGVLIFGWGSCSGCDELQACDSYEDAEKLRQQLEAKIKWMTKTEALEWLNDDWARKSEYSWHIKETRNFYELAKKFIEAS